MRTIWSDLAVLGSGPSGAVCALAAARAGVSVTLFGPPRADAAAPVPRVLFAGGLDALGDLGLAELASAGTPLHSVRRWGPRGAAAELHLERPAIGIARHLLAAGLEEALGREPRVTRVAPLVQPEETGGSLGLHAGGRRHVPRALVLADGAEGLTVPALGSPDPPGSRGSRALHSSFIARPGMADVEVHSARGIRLVLVRLPGRVADAACLLERPELDARSPEKLFERILDELAPARGHLGDRLEGVAVRRLGPGAPRRLARRGAFLAGRSVLGADALRPGGPGLELQSGLLAARAAAEHLAGADGGASERGYARALRRQLAALRRGDRPRAARRRAADGSESRPTVLALLGGLRGAAR